MVVLDHTEVLPTIQLFFDEDTQFSIPIKVLRPDNALEYVQKDLVIFVCFIRTLRQTSCVYTLQQNGVAERKNQ